MPRGWPVAADAAAVAAEEAGGVGAPLAQHAAEQNVVMNGIAIGTGINQGQVALATPTTGNFAAAGYVQATVTQKVPTFFLGTFARLRGSSLGSISVSASAIAGTKSGACTCLTDSNPSDTDLLIGNNATINSKSCPIVGDSTGPNAILNQGGTVCAQEISSPSSNWITNSNPPGTNGNMCGSPEAQNAAACNPPAPNVPLFDPTKCITDPVGPDWHANTMTVGPSSGYGSPAQTGTNTASTVCYAGLTVGAPRSGRQPESWNLRHQWRRPAFLLHSPAGRPGVMFYLTGGARLIVDNGAVLNLVAGNSPEENAGSNPPTAGSKLAPSVGNKDDGVLIYQDPLDLNPINIQGGSGSFMSGEIYAPGAPLNIANGSGLVMDSNIVAYTMTMQGGGTLNTTGSAAGSYNQGVATLVQ